MSSYEPRIYIRDFNVTDYRSFLLTEGFDLDGYDVALLRDLFLRIETAEAGEFFILLSGDEQDDSDDVLQLSGEATESFLVLSDSQQLRVAGHDVIFTYGRYFEIDTAATFVLTGNAAVLIRALRSVGVLGSFALSGAALATRRALIVPAATGTFALTAADAVIDKGFIFVGDSQSYVIIGQAATLTRALTLAEAAGAFALSGNTAALKRSLRMAAAAGSFAFTGIAASLATVDNLLLLSGDEQSGGDGTELSGDMQSGTDLLNISGI